MEKALEKVRDTKADIDRFAKKLENFMAEFSSILSREIDDTAIKADMAGE